VLVLESYASLTKNMHNHELQNILSGIVSQEPGNLIQTVSQKLSAGKEPGSTFKKNGLTKQQEEKILTEFADTNQLWINDIDENSFLAEGAEQRVYLCADGMNVFKLNDAIFYTSWGDYFLAFSYTIFSSRALYIYSPDLQKKKGYFMPLFSSPS